MLKKYFIAAIAAFALWSCSGNEWTVDGRIEGATGKMMYVEASDNGRWYAIDSVALDETGKFSVSHKASGYPDIYRLRLDDKSLYFPIDSIESVTVMAKAEAFDSDYTLAGSPAAEMLMAVDRRVLDSVNRNGLNSLANDSLLKRELGGMLLGDPSGIVSYYIINKRIGGVSLFNPADRRDLRIIGAVANAFDQYRPNDPRTRYLRNLYEQNRKLQPSARRDTVYAQETGMFDIKLYDNRGAEQSLLKLTEQGKTVLLNFTLYSADESPAFNRQLHKVYEKYHGRGVEIFQVSVDDDEYAWRQAAAALPWITVYSPKTDAGTRLLLNYNVQSVPVTFIINRNGDVVERVEDIDKLDGAVAKHL